MRKHQKHEKIKIIGKKVKNGWQVNSYTNDKFDELDFFITGIVHCISLLSKFEKNLVCNLIFHIMKDATNENS